MTPRATYRFQFTAEFTFADAAALAPYLSKLGISHVYTSPILAAREGSTHGYDGVHYSLINPELGGEEGFRAMAATLREKGIGLIVDFVPNHMGVGGADNAFWLSVLEWGPLSPVAGWFDIDWDSNTPGLSGKVLVPFLGDHYGEVLAAGDLQLQFDPEKAAFAIWAHDTHKLPVCPQCYGEILRRGELTDLADAYDAVSGKPPTDPAWKELRGRLRDADMGKALASYVGEPGDLDSWKAMDALIEAQHWRPVKFSMDGDAINYRRFFTMSDLAGVRVEKPEVFRATHQLILPLMQEGVIDGIRIDHIDGLIDPKGYCLRLRAALDRPFPLYVEKILAPDEELPEDWQSDGTTGYEFANQVVGLLVDPAGKVAMTEIYAEFTGQNAAPEDIVHTAKLEIMAQPMASELEALTDRFLALAQDDPRRRDFGRAGMRAGISQVVAGLDVYRTYVDRDGIRDEDRARIAAAVDRAKLRAPEIDPGIFDFIALVLTLDLAEEHPEQKDDILKTTMRMQQFTGPVMAKGLEDRALYRYARMIALNEVGSEPGHFGLEIEAFHAANIARNKSCMLTTSTHDTKRGEDARMRIAALTGHPDLWRERVTEWHDLLADEDQPLDRSEEYFFYQLLFGAWDADWTTVPSAEALAGLRERVEAGMMKSVREAAVNTRWVFGNEDYEAALTAFIGRALGSPDTPFLRSFRGLVAELAPHGLANTLIQTALKLTVPGMPDIYQGAELWEQSLVDPDNRRPVDFALRERLLAEVMAEPAALAPPDQGAVKLALTAALLNLRREKPELFLDGDYRAVTTEGPGAASLCAFERSRGADRMLVACALHPASSRPHRDATRLVADGDWINLLTGEAVTDLTGAALFGRLPVAVLVPR